jgi:hypothetical protein
LGSNIAAATEEDSRLVDRAGVRHLRIQLYLAKGVFVVGDILLQNRHQRLRLLRAQINALKVVDLDFRLAPLLHGAEDKKEVPYVDTYLDAVGVVLAIACFVYDLNIWLSRHGHAEESNRAKRSVPNRIRRLENSKMSSLPGRCAESGTCPKGRFHAVYRIRVVEMNRGFLRWYTRLTGLCFFGFM